MSPLIFIFTTHSAATIFSLITRILLLNMIFSPLYFQIVGLLGIVFGALILNSIRVIEVNGEVGLPVQAVLPIMLITLGFIVVFIAFLGCCGAIRESVCMTMCYAVFLLILLIIQLTVVVLLWTNKDKFNIAMGQVIDRAWESRNKEPTVFEAIQVSVSMLVVFNYAIVRFNICLLSFS